jgi:glycosyltransferase involved in cell wall biosynthesis
VIAVDLGQPALIRAYLLADLLAGAFDVELVGSHFPHWTKLWRPLADARIALRRIPGARLPRYFCTLEATATALDADVIYASKPKFPSYGLGILAKEAIPGRPLLLDLDDREILFHARSAPIELEALREHEDGEEFVLPTSALWDQHYESLIPYADHVTASNPALAAFAGGTVLPQVRDERVFDPALYDRAAIRRRLGFEPSERIILFAGAAHPHKGLERLATAVTRLRDPAVKLAIVGDVSPLLIDALAPHAGCLRLIPPQPFADMAAITCSADLVCLPQDAAHPATSYQIPMKLTDALAMAVPCMATPLPPLAKHVSDGLVTALDARPLEDQLRALFDQYAEVKARAVANREIFVAEYSYAAVRPRLTEKIRQLANHPPTSTLPEQLSTTLAFQRSAFTSRESQMRLEGIQAQFDLERLETLRRQVDKGNRRTRADGQRLDTLRRRLEKANRRAAVAEQELAKIRKRLESLEMRVCKQNRKLARLGRRSSKAKSVRSRVMQAVRKRIA